MRRKQILACAKVAGYHGDSWKTVWLYIENYFVSVKSLQKAYLVGQRIRAKEDEANEERMHRISSAV